MFDHENPFLGGVVKERLYAGSVWGQAKLQGGGGGKLTKFVS